MLATKLERVVEWLTMNALCSLYLQPSATQPLTSTNASTCKCNSRNKSLLAYWPSYLIIVLLTFSAATGSFSVFAAFQFLTFAAATKNSFSIVTTITTASRLRKSNTFIPLVFGCNCDWQTSELLFSCTIKFYKFIHISQILFKLKMSSKIINENIYTVSQKN